MFCFSERDVSATYDIGASYDEHGNLQDVNYTDDVMNLGVEGCEEGDEEGYQQEEGEAYAEEYSQEENPEISEDQTDYTRDLCDDDNGFQDEVLDIQINEPIDGEFQVSSHFCLLLYKDPCTHILTHTRILQSLSCPSLLCG